MSKLFHFGTSIKNPWKRNIYFNMKYMASKLLSCFIFFLIGIGPLSYGQQNKSSIDERKLIPGWTSETFYHDKLKKTILINGGLTPGPWHTTYIELWLWENNDWNLISDDGPEVRNFFSWAYDNNRNVLVIYGGNNRKNYADTWEWNGTNWVQIEAPINPGRISAAKMVYDPVRKACILFGGYSDENNGFELRDDTWAYSGKEWKQLFTDGPSPRFPATMVYFPVNKKIYLYGGHAPGSRVDRGNTGDTWELSQTGWKEIKFSTNPGIRATTEMVFNKKTKTLWMVGQADTWEFNGKQWTQSNIKGLPPRNGHGSTYNPSMGMVMIYGGVIVPGGSRVKDVWALDHDKKEWKCISGCIEDQEQWISEHPGDSDALLNLIATLYSLDKQTQAEIHISKTVNSSSLNRNSLTRLGSYLLSVKKYEESIKCFEKALNIESRGSDFYNLACAYSLINNKDKAFENLNKAAENGFNSKQQFENDSDLQSLKSDSRFQELLTKLK